MQVRIQPELERFVLEEIQSGHFDSPEQVVGEALRLLREASNGSSASAPRVGGQWRGRVHIAEDFDELPDDLQRAFGIGS